jgi:hypothetical protein
MGIIEIRGCAGEADGGSGIDIAGGGGNSEDADTIAIGDVDPLERRMKGIV